MSNYKATYAEATRVLSETTKIREDAAIGILEDFLAEKGVHLGKPCSVTYGRGVNEKEVVGVFIIIAARGSALLKFRPYKKDGTLSKNPKNFFFGDLLDLSWENKINLVTRVVPCEAPEVLSTKQEEE